MTMHLTDQELRHFRQRLISADEALLLDQHLATCADCAQRLSETPPLQEIVGWLQADLAEVESEPCSFFSFAQKSDYVNGLLSLSELNLAQMHLEQCAECCLDLAELQAVRASLAPTRD